jgi:hypothetical protein
MPEERTENSTLFDLSPKKNIRLRISLGVMVAIIVALFEGGRFLLGQYIELRDEWLARVHQLEALFPKDVQGRAWEATHGVPVGEWQLKWLEEREQKAREELEERCKDYVIQSEQSARMGRRKNP